MALNDKQEKFAQAYILHRNATEAAKTAGYASASAYNQGYRNLQSEEIKQRIEELENTLETSVDVITEIEKQYEFAEQYFSDGEYSRAIDEYKRFLYFFPDNKKKFKNRTKGAHL